jgi:hypothetical protein
VRYTVIAALPLAPCGALDTRGAKKVGKDRWGTRFLGPWDRWGTERGIVACSRWAFCFNLEVFRGRDHHNHKKAAHFRPTFATVDT